MERSSGAAPPRQPGGGDETERNVERLSVRVEPATAGASVVSLSGELDLSTIPRVESRLFEEMRSADRLVVDLSRLSFIDSSGIGLLIKAFRSTEGSLHVVIARESQVERVFTLAGIDRALPIFLDREAALAALDGGAPG